MHLYLHIGAEKTGTTAIQRLLQINRKRLEAKGVLFPRTPGSLSHVGLAVAAQDDDKRDELRVASGVETTEAIYRARRALAAGLRREVGASTAHTVIFSNEHCSSRLTSVSEIERLYRMLRPLSVGITIVVYVRRQDELLARHYSAYIRSGGTEKLTLKKEEDRRWYYDHWPMIANWVAVFGRAEVVVRRYHRRWLVAGDAVDDFCAVVGIDPPSEGSDLERPPRENESLDANACEFLRLFNGFMPNVRMGSHLARGGIESMLAQLSPGAGAEPRSGRARCFHGELSRFECARGGGVRRRRPRWPRRPLVRRPRQRSPANPATRPYARDRDRHVRRALATKASEVLRLRREVNALRAAEGRDLSAPG
jgi:hypothetical protein